MNYHNSDATQGSNAAIDVSQLTVGERILKGLNTMYRLQKEQAETLRRIAQAVEAQTPLIAITRPMKEYATFAWAEHGIEVMQTDQYGVARVGYRGQIYTRRTNDKFGSEIWYSRGIGNDEYEKLISFKEFEPPEPLGHKAQGAVSRYQRPQPNS